VLAKPDERGDKRVIAYAAVRDRSVAVEALRDYLKEQLPDYMVPAAIVLLPKLPLNANGKIDRQALPEPEAAAAASAYVKPATPTEEAVAAIWEEVFKRERIGAQENFFDSGGHSLLATQVVSRVRQRFEVEVAMRVLFERPTVRGFAEAIDEALATGAKSDEPKLVPVPRAAYRRGRE
jgi:acyl carrier protein